MSDRSMIFNMKGAQIGYIEGDRAFDLSGRERCKYARTTGNLCELNGQQVVGHISLDGTFIGLAWMSDLLFGKSNGEVHPSRTLAGKQRSHFRPKKLNVQQPEKSNESQPKNVSQRHATALQPESVVEHSPTVSKSGGDPEKGSDALKMVADEAPLPQDESSIGGPEASQSSYTDDELLARAMGMIRSALEKKSE
jgi:hypothetical protein